MSLVHLKTYFSQSEALTNKASLEAADIFVVLFNQNLTSMVPFMSLATGGIRLMVAEEDYEAALELLELTEDLPSDLETDSEAFERNFGSSIFGLATSFLIGWIPWWSRDRKFKSEVDADTDTSSK